MPAKQSPQSPSIDLYLEVRAGFIRRGTTLSAWCAAHGVARQNAMSALRGGWRGPKARKLVAQIIRAAKVVPYKEAA